MTKIMPCTCKHEFQDKTYGPGMRVFNYGLHAHNKTKGWRCTVCLNTKPASDDEKKN